jgi:hypothetical protein
MLWHPQKTRGAGIPFDFLPNVPSDRLEAVERRSLLETVIQGGWWRVAIGLEAHAYEQHSNTKQSPNQGIDYEHQRQREER